VPHHSLTSLKEKKGGLKNGKKTDVRGKDDYKREEKGGKKGFLTSFEY